MTLYMQPVQDLTIDSTISRAPYHFVLEDANSTEFATWVPKLVERLPTQAQLTDGGERAAAARPDRQSHHRPRHCRPVRHHAGDRRQRALRCLRPAHHFDDLHPVEPVPRDPGSRSACSSPLDTLSSIYLPSRRRPPTARCRCRRSRMSNSYRAAVDHAFRTVPGDDHFVQYRAGRVARRGGRGDPAGGKGAQAAEQLHHRVSGRRGGVPVARSPTSCG